MGKKVGRIVLIGLTIVIVFVLLNIFSRFLYSKSWFGTTTLSTEVNPFDIITLIVTTAVTLWLGWFVSKKITEQRYQKEYLICDLKEIEQEVKSIEKSTQGNSIDLQSLISFLSKLRTYIDRFSKTLEVFQIEAIDISELEKQYKKLYKKTTDLDGNQLIVDEINRNEIEMVCSEFVIQTRKMIHKVNSF